MTDDTEIPAPYDDELMNQAYRCSLNAVGMCLDKAMPPGAVEQLIMDFIDADTTTEDDEPQARAIRLMRILSDTFTNGSALVFGTGFTMDTVGDPRMLIRTPEDDGEIQHILRDHPGLMDAEMRDLVKRKESMALSRQASEDSIYLVREAADEDNDQWSDRMMEVLNSNIRVFALTVFLAHVVAKLYVLKANVDHITGHHGSHHHGDSSEPPAGEQDPPGADRKA